MMTNSPKKILISAPYMLAEREKVETYLKPYPFEVDWAEVKERLSEEELLRVIDRYDGVICGDDRFTPKVYSHATRLKVVVKWGTGIDSLAQDEARRRGITVCRTIGAFTRPVADSTLGLILAHCRNLFANDQILKSGGWHKPKGRAIFEISVGIIGFGDIGQAVAARLQAFGPEIVRAYDPADKGDAYAKFGVIKSTLQEVCLLSDVISLHCDLNPTSEKLLSRHQFDQMTLKPFIINTARGSLIDEQDLINALEKGQIAGAGIDVFEDEPLPLKSPLRSSDRVILSAHNTNSSPRSWDHVHRNSIKMLAEQLGVQ